MAGPIRPPAGPRPPPRRRACCVAAYGGAVAERYPWVWFCTPVNEILSRPRTAVWTAAGTSVIVQSESAEYTHHVSAAPSHAVKLRNKLVFLSLDLLYSKAPDADVMMFAMDNGLTRDEFMWFMKSAHAGFQVMGNDYYGHNEKLFLPDGTMIYGEDVLGWYQITMRYYRRYYKPVMHTETSTPFPEINA